jgi:ABC-type bacteriocin/lantibiotic exporter with double-glycine peptidase domain
MPEEGLSSLLHRRHWNVILSSIGDMSVTSFLQKYHGLERKCWEQCCEKMWRANRTIIRQSQNQTGTKTRNQLHWVLWSILINNKNISDYWNVKLLNDVTNCVPSWRTRSIRNTRATNQATNALWSKAMELTCLLRRKTLQYPKCYQSENWNKQH